MLAKIKSAFSSALASIEGKKTYIWATIVTVVCFVGMLLGKVDFQTGFSIIGTMGIGSFLRASQPDKKCEQILASLPPLQMPAPVSDDAETAAAPMVVSK